MRWPPASFQCVMQYYNVYHQLGPQCAFQSGENMKATTSILTLALCFVGAAVCFAAEPHMGTWKHNEWTGKFDGKDYPVTGDPNADTRSYKKVNDHTLAFTNKKGDKVTISGRGVVSADGKTRTVTISGTDSKDKKYTSTVVYDKQ